MRASIGRAALAIALVPAAAGAAVPGRFYIPPVVAMRDMTPAEDNANRVWNLRAALNVAALQCQFSPFLRTVGLYNDVIKHHARELEAARATMAAHFKRLDGATAARNTFDQYTTRTYNSYSTLDAQIAFCETAAMAGRWMLTAPKGGFGAMAARQLPEVRASLSPQEDPKTRLVLAWATVPEFVNPCLDKKRKPIKRCLEKP